MLKVTVKFFRHERKDLMTRNVHVKYESPTSSCSKVMAKIKVCGEVGQGHKVIELGAI